MAGKFFEEWRVGERISHRARHTVAESDDVEIKSISHLLPPLLKLEVQGADAQTGRLPINRTFALAFTIGVPIDVTTLGVSVSRTSYEQVKMPSPVFVDDVLSVETEVVEMTRYRARFNAGNVTFKHVTKNQRGDVVCECLAISNIKSRP